MDFIGLKKIYEATRVPICVYKGHELAFRMPESESYYYYGKQDDEDFLRLYATLRQADAPVLLTEDASVWYGAFLSGSFVVILGPTVREKADYAMIRAFKDKHSLFVEPVLPKVSGNCLRSTISLAYYAVTGLDQEADQNQGAN